MSELINIRKNKFVLKSGKEILLKGVNIPDPICLKNKERQNIREVIEIISNLGANCIRVPVLPGHFKFYKNFFQNYIDPVVDLCEEKNLFCILDWHAIGNPLTGETRLKKYFHESAFGKIFWYDSNINLAKKGLEELSKRYGDNNHVLFELFNEPAPANKSIPSLGLSSLRWSDWKQVILNLIRIVRKNTNNVIIVGSTLWTYNLVDTAKDPIENEKNIAYACHIYPIKIHTNWKICNKKRL